MTEKLAYKGEKQQVSQVLGEQKKQNKDQDLNLKKSKKYQLLYDKNMHLTKKIQTIEDHQVGLKHKYATKMVDKHVKHDEH